jgi:protein-tyrosine kinase
MSRIEEALEKAKSLRGEAKSSETNERVVQTQTDELLRTAIKEISASPYLVVLSEPDSPITEEYRKLKSKIVQLTQAGGGFQNTLMITSTMAEEGKSITALNLAITMAQEYDHTVLLVDADLRKPSLHKYLGIESELGLSDVLTKGIDVQDVLVQTGIGKLVFLPAGGIMANPVELFMSKKMKDLIYELKHRYTDRYIIFDAPPILPFAEVQSIAAIMDGVVFLVREGHAPVNAIKEAMSLLKDTKIFGVVYNDAEVSHDRQHYYYNYRNYYNRKLSKGQKI